MDGSPVALRGYHGSERAVLTCLRAVFGFAIHQRNGLPTTSRRADYRHNCGSLDSIRKGRKLKGQKLSPGQPPREVSRGTDRTTHPKIYRCTSGRTGVAHE